MIESTDDNVPVQRIATASEKVVGVRRRARPVRQREELQRRGRNFINPLGRNDITRERLPRRCGRSGPWIVNQNWFRRRTAQIGEVALTVEQSRNGRRCIEAGELPGLLPCDEEMRLVFS